MIKVKNLKKYFGPVKAVDGISFEIKKGEIVGFLGPNGAGKTTTMKILTCFMPATEGKAMIAGMDVSEAAVEIRKKIGYLPENTPLYSEMNVLEYLSYLGEMHEIPASKKKERLKDVLVKCGLKDKVREEIGNLSKGFRQRVGLAQALIHDPDILILDEPTTGLDPNQVVEIRNLIKEIGKTKTIILCSHILPEVEATCNRVIIIHQGKIVGEGSPSELSQEASQKTRIYLEVEGAADTVMARLKTLNGIMKMNKLASQEKGVSRIVVETEPDLDLRKKINHFLVDSGLELVGMQREKVSLEEVFRNLTGK